MYHAEIDFHGLRCNASYKVGGQILHQRKDYNRKLDKVSPGIFCRYKIKFISNANPNKVLAQV